MAPIFRRHTKHSEGFLGGGHWKYNVKTNEMFPFSERVSSKVDGGEDEETVGDDATVAIKDVAAGFIRMGILPRIRFILEVFPLFMLLCNTHSLAVLQNKITVSLCCTGK
jgi:hypothetical protein